MSNKKLSILLQKGGFSFCVLNDEQLVHSAHVRFENTADKSYSELVSEHFNKQLYLNQKYNQVSIAFLSNQFNLVPNEYFESESDPQKWLEFNADVYEDDQIQYGNLSSHDAKLVYAFPKELEEYLRKKFKDFDLKNASEIFINSFQIETEDAQAFINIHLNQIEILIFKDQKLYFYNLFDVETKEDIVYYILNTFEQLELDANSIEVYYFGWNLEEAALKMLMNFVRHVMPGTSDKTELMHYSEIQNLS